MHPLTTTILTPDEKVKQALLKGIWLQWKEGGKSSREGRYTCLELPG